MPFAGEDLKVKYAWIAAALDGEGCLSCYSRPDRGLSGSISVHIGIANTNYEFVKVFMEACDVVYKINVSDRENTISGGRRKTIYSLVIARQEDVCRILKVCLPYLIIKKKRAALAVDWLEGRLVRQRRYTKMDFEALSRMKEA